MSVLFKEITCAVYVTNVDLESKVRHAVSKSEFITQTKYIYDEEEFKEHIQKNNINIAICDVDLEDEKVKNKMEKEKLPRELIGFRKGTYFIFIVPSLDLTLATTLYRLGIEGIVYDTSKHLYFKKAVEKAEEHVKTWQTIFLELLENKAFSRDFDQLLNEIEED